MTSPESNVENRSLSALLELESMARRAESEKALQFLMVNETRRLLNFRQAFLFSKKGTTKGATRYQVEAASSLSLVDRDSPMVTWLELFASRRFRDIDTDEVLQIDAAALPEEDQQTSESLSFQHVIWCPLRLSDGLVIGGIWLARETPWLDNELVLIKRLCETYAHAWAALVGRSNLAGTSSRQRWLIGAAFAALVVISLLPVRLSTIAPAETVALDPAIVSAPMDGVIKALVVSPNTPVNQGDVLFQYEDTNLRNAYEIALQARNVATARLRQASQGAFRDDASRGQVALLQAELSLKETELAYAAELLQQVEVRADKAGLLVYSEASDWVGKPVIVGERVMEIVDTEQVQFRISLPVDDAIVLGDGAKVEVFLHAQPLKSIGATVTKTSYNAYLTPESVLAYRVDAEITETGAGARIGLQGSARVYGEKVSVFFYVFRRPISALRQLFGI